jgi:hypothetical protein
VQFNPSVVTAIVGGIVALVVALVGIAPNVGQFRRLERVVAMLEKTTDPFGRARLTEMRNRIIQRLEPSDVAKSSKSRVLVRSDIAVRIWGTICGVGLVLDFGGLILMTIRSIQIYGEASISVGIVVLILGTVFSVRASERGDGERAALEAASVTSEKH